MDDVSELSAQEAAGANRRRTPYIAAVVVAVLSAMAWWGVRANEIQQVEIAYERQVESEFYVLQDRLEQVEELIADVEAALVADGIESEAARSLIEQGNTRFTQFAIVQPASPGRSSLAFAADDFEPYADVTETEKLLERDPNDRSIVSVVAGSSSVVSISKSLDSQSNNLDQPTVVIAIVALTAAPLADADHKALTSQFLFEVDGTLLEPATSEGFVGSTVKPARFAAGEHQWSMSPVASIGVASHLGSNVLWAAGVALTTLVFLYQRRYQNDVETHDELMHSFFRLTDPVTGFLNAEGVQGELRTRLKRRRRTGQVGVLLCNIDRYESIKKGLGPSMADDVVRMTLVRIQSLLTGSDSCGRFGESQLLVMSNGLPAVSDLERLAERICLEFVDPLELPDGTICHVSFTIGIALTRSSETTAASLLADVSSAQSAAVERGGTNYFVFSEAQRLKEAVRNDLLNELLDAVRQRQLTVHYQPVVRMGQDASDMLPIGKVEAFVRWPHPVRGMVHPGVFLPLAIEAGVDLKVAEMVLTDACRQALLWSEQAGRPITVVVNVGERQLVDLRLVGVVRDVLRTTGLPVNQLELDIPEELVLRANVGTQEVMQQLAVAGVKISLDDFGASSGSLQKLVAATIISTVKIDRAFVEDIATNEVNQKVISAVVSMAHHCGISVVAEGVETNAELTALYDLGVTELQGFLFNRPGPPGTIGDLLGEGSLVPMGYEANP